MFIFLTFSFLFCRTISDSTSRRSRQLPKNTKPSRRTSRRTRSACWRWWPWPESWRRRTTTTSSASPRAKTTCCVCGSICWSCSKHADRGWRWTSACSVSSRRCSTSWTGWTRWRWARKTRMEEGVGAGRVKSQRFSWKLERCSVALIQKWTLKIDSSNRSS